MIAVLLKGLLFYFFFVFIKNVITGYRTYQRIKSGTGAESSTSYSGAGTRGSSRRKSSKDDDVVEAEYRVIKD